MDTDGLTLPLLVTDIVTLPDVVTVPVAVVLALPLLLDEPLGDTVLDRVREPVALPLTLRDPVTVAEKDTEELYEMETDFDAVWDLD